MLSLSLECGGCLFGGVAQKRSGSQMQADEHSRVWPGQLPLPNSDSSRFPYALCPPGLPWSPRMSLGNMLSPAVLMCMLLKQRQPKTTRDKLRSDVHAVRLLVCPTLQEQWPRARSRDTSRRFVCLRDSERTAGKPGSMCFLSWDPGKWWDAVLSWGRSGLAGGDPRSWMG